MPSTKLASRIAPITHAPNLCALLTQPMMGLMATVLLLVPMGCSLLKKDGDDSSMAKLLEPPTPPDLIREAAVPRGLKPIKVTGIGLVNSLPGTGGPTDPSPWRDQLIEEMQHNDIKSPNQILEQDTNAMVRVTAIVPPGAARGDTIDLRIDSPPGNNASDLHGGWLLDTRLKLEQILQGRVRTGELMAMATGPLLTRAAIESDAEQGLKTQAYALGGGTVQKTRKMGLVIRPEFQHVHVSKQIAEAVNRRMFFFDGTTRRGVAKPIEDDYVELELHPRYEGSLGRYVAVVQAIGIDERKANQQSRLQTLAEMLRDPATSSDAALQLEALGESAIPTLVAGTEDANPEIRFYAAEALAYLDRDEAIKPLVDAIENESAFRYAALAALEGLDDPRVVDALWSLFDKPSLETRYGAFVSLRNREDASRVITPESTSRSLATYEIESSAPAAIAVSTRERPEVVIFGNPSPIDLPAAIVGPNALILRAQASDPAMIRISRFEVGQDDRRALSPNSVAGIIRGIQAVGGDYADIVAILRIAKSKGYLKDQLAINPLPKPLQTYYRDEESS